MEVVPDDSSGSLLVREVVGQATNNGGKQKGRSTNQFSAYIGLAGTGVLSHCIRKIINHEIDLVIDPVAPLHIRAGQGYQLPQFRRQTASVAGSDGHAALHHFTEG
jgi:hypothetical protein